MSMICVCGVVCAWVVTGGGVRWRDGRTLFSLGPRLVTSRYIVSIYVIAATSTLGGVGLDSPRRLAYSVGSVCTTHYKRRRACVLHCVAARRLLQNISQIEPSFRWHMLWRIMNLILMYMICIPGILILIGFFQKAKNKLVP